VIAYRITLVLRSGLGTPLAADTLWGHLAWGFRYRHGESALIKWLDRYDAGDPPIVISDPLPAGFLPRPRLLAPPRPTTAPTEEDAARHKRLAKVEWISHDSWRAVADDLSPTSVIRWLERDDSPDKAAPSLLTTSVMHAGINRLSGGTAQEGGGTLYAADQSYGVPSATRYDVWARSAAPADEIGELFEDGLGGGYGRDGATGLGQLRIADVSVAEIPRPNRPNAIMLLGPTIPRRGDPYRGFISFGVRCGRLGGEFAIGQTPDGASHRQKHPVHCLLRGSVLVAEPGPEYMGRVVSGVHEYRPIRHYGLSLGIPCRLDSATLERALS
jgi:CRISPR-associated protein Csm4